ncbi:hypothetical protein [Rhodomicrobium lacus]|uniref:hypothetical protein n=1 Tax=Rhodomicrobium lacus TaxID=2498452 RepID=UPI000F8F0ADF|nr:hypothetical protein [Rhodomicrobium lacus]WKW49481.1 hypothetical protein QMO75_09205 [Rhodomicrobium lacus]
MRYGLIGSVILHLLVFGLVIFNFASSGDKDVPPPPPVSVEIMSPKDFSERQQGKVEAKAQTPAPPAELKAPDTPATAKKEVEQKPSQKPTEKEALAPPPPKAEPTPAPQPKPVEQAKAQPAPAPEKPVEKPKPVVKKEPPPKPKAEVAAKNEDRPKPAAEKQPERSFDPNHIASLIKKDQPAEPRQQTSRSTMDTQPAKTYSDRQTAVLNRDPNAGAPSGNFEPGKPWRPASSLQDQAMGVPQAQGSMNAGSCADLVQSRIEQNWDLPLGAAQGEMGLVRLHIELNRDGTLIRPPMVMDAPTSPTGQAMADAAIRAAMRGAPYSIPPAQYERCRDMVLRFNPRDMYGG